MPTPTEGEAPRLPAPVEPRRPGKGGPEHTYLQELIKRWGEEHGFRAVVEEQIPGSRESVDVALYRGNTRIACEVSVTTPLEYEVGNVEKCLAVGFSSVAVVSLKKSRLEKLSKLFSESLSTEQRARVHLFTPDELLSWLAVQQVHEEVGTVREQERCFNRLSAPPLLEQIGQQVRGVLHSEQAGVLGHGGGFLARHAALALGGDEGVRL